MLAALASRLTPHLQIAAYGSVSYNSFKSGIKSEGCRILCLSAKIHNGYQPICTHMHSSYACMQTWQYLHQLPRQIFEVAIKIASKLSYEHLNSNGVGLGTKSDLPAKLLVLAMHAAHTTLSFSD